MKFRRIGKTGVSMLAVAGSIFFWQAVKNKQL